MPAQNQRKGFTLVELLVAVSIVAIVSAIGYINYTTAQSSARDAKRKQDLQAMKVGLELYYQANKRYPCTQRITNSGWSHSANGSPLTPWLEINDYADTSNVLYNCPLPGGINFNKAYINVLPTDPLKNTGLRAHLANNYGYSYYGDDVVDGILGFSGSNCGTAFKKGKYYILVTQLENGSDPDAYGSGSNVLCGGTHPATGFGPKTYIVAPDYH